MWRYKHEYERENGEKWEEGEKTGKREWESDGGRESVEKKGEKERDRRREGEERESREIYHKQTGIPKSKQSYIGSNNGPEHRSIVLYSFFS